MDVEVRGLSKSFGLLQVLDRVSFTIGDGRITAVIGASGSGKTTLLRCLDLLERADAGEMTLGRHTIDLARASAKEALKMRRRIGFVFQQYNLFLHRTVRQNIVDTLRFGHGWTKSAATERAHEVLAAVELIDYQDQYPLTLSGGQAQRAAIARAVAAKPDLLMLDEPTSALDPSLIREVTSVIRELAAAGTTMLLVTHVLALVRDVSDEVLFLHEGAIAERGSVTDVLDYPDHPELRRFLAETSDI